MLGYLHDLESCHQAIRQETTQTATIRQETTQTATIRQETTSRIAFWTLPDRLPGILTMLGYLHDLESRHRRSLRRLRRPRFVRRRLVVQQQPKTVTLNQSSTLLSLAKRSSDLTIRHIVTQPTHLARI